MPLGVPRSKRMSINGESELPDSVLRSPVRTRLISVWLKMARPGRLELPTLCLEGRRSIQLSYGRTGTARLILEHFWTIPKKIPLGWKLHWDDLYPDAEKICFLRANYRLGCRYPTVQRFPRA
jgi:hypothetical protein